MALEKIISAGQSGVDRAALDVAIALSIPHGGYIRQEDRDKASVWPDIHHFRAIPGATDAEIAAKNIDASDGTLIVSHGEFFNGDWAVIPRLAEGNRLPWLHIDLNSTSAFRAAGMIKSWLEINGVGILYVTGAWGGQHPDLYPRTVEILKTVFYMGMIGEHLPDPVSVATKITGGIASIDLPATVDQAVDWLTRTLSFRDKSKIANMPFENLSELSASLGRRIISAFDLAGANHQLLDACLEISGKDRIQPEHASRIILTAFWQVLQHENVLRVVK